MNTPGKLGHKFAAFCKPKASTTLSPMTTDAMPFGVMANDVVDCLNRANAALPAYVKEQYEGVDDHPLMPEFRDPAVWQIAIVKLDVVETHNYGTTRPAATSPHPLLFGTEHQEELSESAWACVENAIEEAADGIDEGFDATADRMSWPLRVLAFRRIDASHMLPRLAENALESILESLDEELASMYSSGTKPTDGKRAASVELVKAVLNEYTVFACEPTGEVIEFSREKAKALFGTTPTL